MAHEQAISSIILCASFNGTSDLSSLPFSILQGYAVEQFGQLLLQDKFMMATNDVERELQVFFFEKILLICKEIKDKNKLSKTNSISIKKKRRASLQLKGKIFIASIIQIVNTSKNGEISKPFLVRIKQAHLTNLDYFTGVWSLKVHWRDAEMESFSLKCRNEEQLKLWESSLNKVLQENKINGGTNGTAKRNVSNTQLASLAHLHISPRTYGDDDDAASFIDEEEEEDESEEYSHDDDDDESRSRSRSNSINPAAYARTRSSRSESSASDYHPSWRTGTPPMPSTSNSRHYNNMPGMTLPPLPKSNPSVTTSSTLTTPTAEYGLYPASPPPSNPSSPTTSSRASSNGNGTVRQRRGTDEASPLSETIVKFMMNNDTAQHPNGGPSNTGNDESRPYPGSMGRAQSHSAASGVGLGLYSSSGTPPIPPNAAALSQTRLRSQSSPNIHRPGAQNSWEQQQHVHDMPINSRTIYNRSVDPNFSSPVDAGRTSPRFANINDSGANDSAATYNAAAAATESSAPSPGMMRLKLNFHDNIYAIVVSPDIDYQELMDKVGKKIRVVAGLGPTDPLRIKYQDEDGDLITINSDDDVQMGFESRGGSNTINLFIS